MTAEIVEIGEQLAAARDAEYDAQFDLTAEEVVPGSAPVLLPRFEITDIAKADWALRKIAQAKARRAEEERAAGAQILAVMEEADRLLAPVREVRDREVARHNETITFMEHKLAEFHRGLLADDDKRKTVRLAHGKLSARKQPDRWEFSDEFVEWAKENADDLLRTKFEVDVLAAKAVLDNTQGGVALTGELVPGVTFTPGEVKFTVEAGDDL